MEDLQDRLAAIGYRRASGGAGHWHVAQADASPLRRTISRRRVAVDFSPALRFWVWRLRADDRPSPYRVQRII